MGRSESPGDNVEAKQMKLLTRPISFYFCLFVVCVAFQLICQKSPAFRWGFERLFDETYSAAVGMGHQKLLAAATFFGYLLATETIGWKVVTTIITMVMQ